MNATPTPHAAVEALGWIMQAILRGLGTRANRTHPELLLPGAFLGLIWNRMNRLASRFARLVEKIEAGTLPPLRPRPAAPRPGRPRPSPSDPALRMPRKRGWLLPVGKHDAGAAHNQLRRLFEQPDMAALLAAEPRRLGRILRPLCWALGVTPPPIIARPPPRPGAAPADAVPSGAAPAAASPASAATQAAPGRPTGRPSRDAAARPRRPPAGKRAPPDACGPPPVPA